VIRFTDSRAAGITKHTLPVKSGSSTFDSGALRGVRLVAYDSVCAYIRRAAHATGPASDGDISTPNRPAFDFRPEQDGFPARSNAAHACDAVLQCSTAACSDGRDFGLDE